MLDQEKLNDSLHNADTLYKALSGAGLEEARKVFEDLASGKEAGMLILLRVNKGVVISHEPDEEAAQVEGVVMVNGLPIAAVVRAVVDQFGLSITEVVGILEATRTEGRVVTH